MKCEICEAELTTADVRCRAELRGICLVCAEEGEFFGMTLEETTRCVAMIRVVRADRIMTAFQRKLQKDMET